MNINIIDIVIFICVYTIIIVEVFKEFKDKNIFYKCLVVLSSFYCLGETAQFTLIGPLWFRYWASDIGFVPMITLYFLSINRNPFLGIYTGGSVAIILEVSNIYYHKPGGDWIDVIIFIVTSTIVYFLIRNIKVKT